MITNLVASIAVSLVTNVTEQITGYEHYEPAPCPEGRIGCLVYHQRGVNPTHKTITTNVIEITALTFDWQGKQQKAKSERLISSQSSTWVKEWTPTVSAAIPWVPWGTNLNVDWMTNIWIGESNIIRLPKSP